MDREQRGAIEAVEGGGIGRGDFGVAVQDGPFHFVQIIAPGQNGICSGTMSTQTVRLHRWDEIALEKVTELLSRKIVTGEREMLAQIYLKRGCLVPMHSHESEQMTYILQGALKFLIGGEEITVREGELLHIPSWVEHQAEALDDTFELDVFSPIRHDWLNHTDDYFHR
jgi:quercetin dioxygenase-like cupin family protein